MHKRRWMAQFWRITDPLRVGSGDEDDTTPSLSIRQKDAGEPSVR